MHLLTYTRAVLQPYVDLRTGELMAEVRCTLCCITLACLAGRKRALTLHKHSVRMTTCTLMFGSIALAPGLTLQTCLAALADSNLAIHEAPACKYKMGGSLLALAQVHFGLVCRALACT